VATTPDEQAAPAGPPRLPAPARVFGTLSLGIFTFSFIANVNGVPAMSEYGLASIGFYALALIGLLGPTALVASELGSAWPRTGGIYVWAREAFGPRIGFLVIWLEWSNFVIAFPALMTTLAVQATYGFDKDLGDDKLFVVAVILVATTLLTALALRGVKLQRNLTGFAVITGTLLPALTLVVLAIIYLAQGKHVQIDFDAAGLVPDIGNVGTLVFASSAFLMFAGIEIAAVHAGDVRNPGRTIPRSNLIAATLCILLFVPLTLAIAMIVPKKEINVVTGLMVAFDYFFDAFSIGWMVPVFGILLVVGLSASLVQILGGPARGLMIAARDGNLPPSMQRENARGMPTVILMCQAVMNGMLAFLFALTPSIQDAWWALLIAQTQLTLILYVILFFTAIRLRKLRPDQPRPFRIPGGKAGLYAVTGVGIVCCSAVICLGFIPPDELDISAPGYVAAMAAAVGFVIALPFIIGRFRKPSWTASPPEPLPGEPEPEPIA
jgi:amino acid transporter